jgi:hypothetical protein
MGKSIFTSGKVAGSCMVMEFAGCVGGIAGIVAGAGICWPPATVAAQKARKSPARDRDDSEGLI